MNDQRMAETLPAVEPEGELPKSRGRLRGQRTGSSASASNAPRESAALKRDLAIIRESLLALVGGLGLSVSLVEPFDGKIILERGPHLVDALVALARQQQRVREALLAFVTASAYADVAMASLAILLPILAHHRLLPELFGWIPPVGGSQAKNNGDGGG